MYLSQSCESICFVAKELCYDLFVAILLFCNELSLPSADICF